MGSVVFGWVCSACGFEFVGWVCYGFLDIRYWLGGFAGDFAVVLVFVWFGCIVVYCGCYVVCDDCCFVFWFATVGFEWLMFVECVVVGCWFRLIVLI